MGRPLDDLPNDLLPDNMLKKLTPEERERVREYLHQLEQNELSQALHAKPSMTARV
jgi:hypothetical protein